MEEEVEEVTARHLELGHGAGRGVRVRLGGLCPPVSLAGGLNPPPPLPPPAPAVVIITGHLVDPDHGSPPSLLQQAH